MARNHPLVLSWRGSMALGSQPRWTVRPAVGEVRTDIDVGLRDYMLRIYNYMASGLALTGIVAYAFAQSGLYAQVAATPLIWLIMRAPLGFVLLMSFGLDRMQASTAQALFWVFAAVMGLSLASIFLVFTGASIARVFFITAGTFAAMSLYGYTTKRDLTQIGSFLVMGLIGVIVFVGLTAWDTQRIKETYYQYQYADGQGATKMAIMGALTLYLDFINLFVMLLQLFGARRD